MKLKKVLSNNSPVGGATAIQQVDLIWATKQLLVTSADAFNLLLARFPKTHSLYPEIKFLKECNQPNGREFATRLKNAIETLIRECESSQNGVNEELNKLKGIFVSRFPESAH